MTTTKRSVQEARRLIGGQMLENGCDVEEIVLALQVTAKTVYQWKKILETQGHEGLRRKNGSGRQARLDRSQLERLKKMIRNGAVAYGFPNEQWTSKRVRLVIFEQFHVEYNSNYVCEILRSLDLSPQVPQVHSVKRDQATIDHWKRYVWPCIKKNR
jgi:putative transposase